MTNKTYSDDGEAFTSDEASTSPSRSTAGPTAKILPFPALPAADDWAGEDGGSDCWEAVGTIAVRMVARWSLPFIHCENQAAPDGYEEEGNHREP